MLTRLTVRDFALVRAVDVTFERGLTVLTGESGAGKSILLGALGLALGDRAAAASVRPSAERSDVTAEFDVDGNLRATDFLTSRGLDDPDASNRCVLRRIINREGRSRAYINGAPATSNDLTELAADHPQVVELIALVDALGDHLQPEIVRQLDDGSHDLERARVVADPGHQHG